MQYPIVITKNADSGKFVCVCVFGFEQGENLFWKEGHWDGVYTPLNIARQPFFIGDDTSDTSHHFSVCIDVDHDSFNEKNGG